MGSKDETQERILRRCRFSRDRWMAYGVYAVAIAFAIWRGKVEVSMILVVSLIQQHFFWKLCMGILKEKGRHPYDVYGPEIKDLLE